MASFSLTSSKLFSLDDTYFPFEILANNNPIHAQKQLDIEYQSGKTPKTFRFRVHGLRSKDQARFKIQGMTSWKGLNDTIQNTGVTVVGDAAGYGGIGGYGTVTVEIDLDTVNAAIKPSNIKLLVNKEVYPQGLSSFRLIDFKPLDSNGNDIRNTVTNKHISYVAGQGYDKNRFISSDTNPNKALGKIAWESIKPLQEYPNGPDINASCASCHVADGGDLKYFGYTNESIFKRARFHGLTSNQAKQIVRYIRSGDMAPTLASRGRPWNPPYQPKSGLGDRDVKDWAAGGGLGAVANQDKDTWQDIFGVPLSQINQNRIDNILDGNAELALYDTRVALQLPDWGQWLPSKYPGDLWDDFESASDSPYITYQGILNTIDGKNGGINWYFSNQNRKNQLVELLSSLNLDTVKYMGHNRKPYETAGAPARIMRSQRLSVSELSNLSSGSDLLTGNLNQWIVDTGVEEATKSLFLWASVKQFEILKKYDLEDKADNLFTNGEKRAWPTTRQNVHSNAPHIIARNNLYRIYENQDPFDDTNTPDWHIAKNLYLSTAWYELQQILNVGHGEPSVQTNIPSDWEYQFKHVIKMSELSGHIHSARFFKSLIKAYQVRSRDRTINGFNLRVMHPYWAFADTDGNSLVQGNTEQQRPGLWTLLLNGFVEEFVSVVDNFDLNLNGIDPGPDGKKANGQGIYGRYDPNPSSPTTERWTRLEDKDWVPGSSFELGNNANLFWNLIPRLRALNASNSDINQLINWCDQAWPGNNWSSYPETKNAYYNITSKETDKHLRVINGTNVPISYTTNANAANAKWAFESPGGPWVTIERNGSTNNNGYYLRMNKNQTVGGNANRFQIQSNNGTAGGATQWRLIHQGSNYYRIEVRQPVNGNAIFLRMLNNNQIFGNTRGSNRDDTSEWSFTKK